jgi:hypothetical protein
MTKRNMDRLAAGRRAATKNTDAFNSSLPGRKPPTTSEKLVESPELLIAPPRSIVLEGDNQNQADL